MGLTAPCRELDQQGREQLADALGESPETVISVHGLRRGLARAWVVGDVASPAAAIVQSGALPGEPVGFGEDARAVWGLLQQVPGWFCVDVSPSLAAPLGELIQAERGERVRYYGDVYFTLSQPAQVYRHPAVRLLTLEDTGLLGAAPEELRGAGFGSTRALLAEGVVACAVIGGQVVAIAHTSAISARYADIGVVTAPEWRGRGLATAAAALVAERVQLRGLTPVWSAGEDNWASLRVAEKVGYAEVSRRAYVIVERS
jgi:GNAT superfamily N-acetyltransferase